MKRMLITLAAMALLASSALVAYEERLHKGNALTGETCRSVPMGFS